jgi:membrane protease YdiL (CAAX protease family)
MAKWLRSFGAAMGIGWAALAAAGAVYARLRGLPAGVAAPALAAFLLEWPFYIAPAFPAIRDRLAGARLGPLLAASVALPYLAASGAGGFHWIALAKLVAAALVLGLWFVALPAGALADAGFLAAVGFLALSHYFQGIYPKPYSGVDLTILGRLALAHMAALGLLAARRAPECGYGFLPSARDWRIGASHFLYFAPLGLPLALALRAVRFSAPASAWLVLGTFLGALWVIALFEEFVFRGALQPMLERWTGSRAAALLMASAAFGLAHLPFRSFPNWRWVPVAALLGWFCGRARNQAGNIKAGMVTHALVIAAWRAFFL